MRIHFLSLVVIFLFIGCDNSKWETIKGQGISDEPKTIDNVIYFESEVSGIIGGFTLVDDTLSQNNFKLSTLPTLFLTADGGRKWTEIHFDPKIKQHLRNAYLHLDTLLCQTDSITFLSTNRGKEFKIITSKEIRDSFAKRYFSYNRYEIENKLFLFNGAEYRIKEIYKNKLATLIVCYQPEDLMDYYYVSFDNGTNWKFLQEDFGDNRQRFLFEDEYLFSYKFPFGLQRLKLK